MKFISVLFLVFCLCTPLGSGSEDALSKVSKDLGLGSSPNLLLGRIEFHTYSGMQFIEDPAQSMPQTDYSKKDGPDKVIPWSEVRFLINKLNLQNPQKDYVKFQYYETTYQFPTAVDPHDSEKLFLEQFTLSREIIGNTYYRRDDGYAVRDGAAFKIEFINSL